MIPFTNSRNRFLSPRTLVISSLAFSLGVAGAATLQAQAGSATTTGSPAKKHPVTLDSGSFTDNTVTGIRTLSNGVRITSDGTVMKTALAQYNYRTFIAVAPGNIQIEDERNTLVGNNGKAFYNTRDAVIQGNVKIVVRPKPGSASAPEGSPRREFKDPVTIFCDRVDYNWRTRIAIATGNLTLKQTTSDGTRRTATAKKLTFYTREERLVLEGDVNAVDSKGQKLTGPEAIAITKEGAEQFRMEKGAIATFEVPDEDEPDAGAKPATPPASAGAKTPPAVSGPAKTPPPGSPATPPPTPPAAPTTTP